MSRVRARMRDERGQISVEWVGVLAVFCALVAALLALQLGAPLSRAADHMICAVSSIGKGDCGKDPSPDTSAEGKKTAKASSAKLAAREDPDRDGLSSARERALGLLPGKADTDGDGVTDGDEVDDRTDPATRDTDGDGVDDGAELRAHTDPRKATPR